MPPTPATPLTTRETPPAPTTRPTNWRRPGPSVPSRSHCRSELAQLAVATVGTMIRIDTSSATPPFEQLRLQLMSQITSGELAGGARLPTVRKLAEDLGLA